MFISKTTASYDKASAKINILYKKKKKLASGSVKKKIAILPRENPLTIFLLIMTIGKVFQWL